MQRFIRKYFVEYKEYIVLILFLIISLFALPLNNSSKLKKIKTYSFATYAYLNDAADKFLNLFVNNCELNKLRLENAKLNLRNNLLRERALENAELHRLLNFKNSSSFKLAAARVLSKTTSKTQSFFVINLGLNDSVKLGMPVINDRGLVGIVNNVSNDFSVVKTFKNSEFKISVVDQRSNFNGIMSWDGSNLYLQNVPTSADIQEGDRIVSSSYGTLFPPLISVGIVAKKEQSIPGLLSSVYIYPFVDLDRIKNVFVVKIVLSKKLHDVELNFRREEE